MANPTEVGIKTDYNFATITTSTTASSVTLDPNKRYALRHGSKDESGTAATTAIYLTCDDGSTYSYASGEKKSFIESGEDDMEIGPGVTTLGFKASSGAPIFRITPIENVKGNY